MVDERGVPFVTLGTKKKLDTAGPHQTGSVSSLPSPYFRIFS